MCLTLGVTVLATTAEIRLLFSSQCTFDAPLFSAKVSVYLRIVLVLLIDLYINLIFTPLESVVTAG